MPLEQGNQRQKTERPLNQVNKIRRFSTVNIILIKPSTNYVFFSKEFIKLISNKTNLLSCQTRPFFYSPLARNQSNLIKAYDVVGCG